MTAEVAAIAGEAAAGSRVCHSRVGGGSFDIAGGLHRPQSGE